MSQTSLVKQISENVPSVPEFLCGFRVIPLSSHGIVVYLSIEERHRLAFLNHAGEVLAVGFLVVYFLKKPLGNPRASS
jgi:hypothetical protein